MRKGMRATLATSLVLPGASGVSLETVAPPNSGRLVVTSDPPIIPAASAGSGLEGALAAVNDVAARIRNLPIEEIAGHLRSTAERVDTLVHDPALTESLQRVNRSMADVEKIIATTREKMAKANYALMGGGSPLLPETEKQARALEADLAARSEFGGHGQALLVPRAQVTQVGRQVLHPAGGHRGPGTGRELADGPGVATQHGRRQKPRFLSPETKLMSEKAPQATFSDEQRFSSMNAGGAKTAPP